MSRLINKFIGRNEKRNQTDSFVPFGPIMSDVPGSQWKGMFSDFETGISNDILGVTTYDQRRLRKVSELRDIRDKRFI